MYNIVTRRPPSLPLAVSTGASLLDAQGARRGVCRQAYGSDDAIIRAALTRRDGSPVRLRKGGQGARSHSTVEGHDRYTVYLCFLIVSVGLTHSLSVCRSKFTVLVSMPDKFPL